MNTKHTPGPWTIDGLHIIGNGYSIAHINSHRTTEGRENAELIAAAPETAAERDRLKEINAELLEAANAAIDAIADERADAAYKANVVSMLRDAIAKATGAA